MQRIHSETDALRLWLDWLHDGGARVRLAPEARHAEAHHAPLVVGHEAERVHEFDGLVPVIEHRSPPHVAADHATELVAGALIDSGDCREGGGFVDVGCGSAVLGAVAAALGADRVLATDLDPRALQLARRTLGPFGARAEVVSGPWLEPVPADFPVDVVAANLPHKPVPPGGQLCMAQNGGADGVDVHAEFVDAVVPRMRPGGAVHFFLHSLPHPRLLTHYEQFFDVELWAWRLRRFQPDEYPELMPYWLERHAAGTSLLVVDDIGPALVAGAFRAVLR